MKIQIVNAMLIAFSIANSQQNQNISDKSISLNTTQKDTKSMNNKINHLTQNNLKGPVKTLTQKTYATSDTSSTPQEENLEDISVYTYNEGGTMQNVKNLDANGEETYYLDYKYTTATPSETVVTATNKAGMLVMKQTWKKGILRSQTYFNEQGEALQVKENTLDSNGRIQNTTIFRNGVKGNSNAFTYITAGKVATRKDFDASGNLIQTTTHSYSQDGLEEDVTLTLTVDNASRPSVQRIYNTQGDLVTETPAPPQRTSTRYVYSYDDHNNWIEKKEYNGEQLTFIDTREITYYN